MALTDRIPYQAQVDRPRLRLPDGKKLAVWVILNVEEWRIENAMPRTVLSPPMGQPLLPDVPNWSWHEYGMRAGFLAAVQGADGSQHAGDPGVERERVRLLPPGRFGRTRGRV